MVELIAANPVWVEAPLQAEKISMEKKACH
jgi:hypothetical protein